MRAVDSHFHVFALGATPRPGATYWPSYRARIETWLALSASAGVTHGVLIQPSFLGADNTQMLAALAAHPDRLRAVVGAEATTNAATLAAWHGAGVRGIRFNLAHHPPPDLDAPGWQSVLGAIGDLGWHVELHHNGPGVAEFLPRLAAAAGRVVVDHLGGPIDPDPARDAAFGAIVAAAKNCELYVKLSAPYRIAEGAAPRHAAALLDALGSGRLMWASDWPWTRFESRFAYAETRRWLDQWIDDTEARRAILWDTPAKVFGFGDN
jgi:predicted TIM-barrel fold metal-dependent hydrolase